MFTWGCDECIDIRRVNRWILGDIVWILRDVVG